jgi:hypothetical protein
MHFTTSRPRKKEKAQPGGEAASSCACAIGAYIGLHCQNAFTKLRFGLGPDLTIICSLNLNMIEDRV